MFTGADFNSLFEQRIDKSFNDYYSPDQTDEFFARCFQLAITSKYQDLLGQKRYDQLRGLLVSDKIVPAKSGRITLQPNIIVSVVTLGQQIFFQTKYPSGVSVGDLVNYSLKGANGAIAESSATVLSVVSEYAFSLVTPIVSVPGFISGTMTGPQYITDYMHLFTVNAMYKYESEQKIQSIYSPVQEVVIELDYLSDLRDGDKIAITGSTGCTNINNTDLWVRQVGIKKYRLYTDPTLKTKITSNRKYTGGAVLYRFSDTKAFQTTPDLLNYIDPPTKKFPRWKETDNAIVIEPSEDISHVGFSYISLPPQNILSRNNTVDLLLYYSYEFLQYCIDFFAAEFDRNTKNVQSLQINAPQVVVNQ